MAKKAMKSKDLLALNAAKKKGNEKEKSVAYAKSKRASKKVSERASSVEVKKSVRDEIYEIPKIKSIAVEDTSLQTNNSRFFRYNNGTALALFSNASGKVEDTALHESGTMIQVERPDFRVQFNKLEAEADVLDLSTVNSKIKLEFKDLTPNSKKPAHRPLSIKDNDTVFWKNVDEKTNITFDVRSNRLIQNIVVNKKAEKYEYTYVLNTKNLALVSASDKEKIQLTNGGSERFTLSAPSLKDFEGRKIKAKTFEVKEIAENKVQVSFAFDASEVNEISRFPIEISPEIIAEKTPVVEYRLFSRASESDEWKAGLTSSTAKFPGKSAFEKNVAVISKDVFEALEGKKVSRVCVKLHSDSRDAIMIGNQLVKIPEDGGFVDITKEFLASNGNDIEVEMKSCYANKSSETPQISAAREQKALIDMPNANMVHEVDLPVQNFGSRNLPDIGGVRVIPSLDDFGHGVLDVVDRLRFQELPRDWRFKIPEIPTLGDNFGKIEIVPPAEIGTSDVVAEYFIDDEMMPASETYSFAGGVEGTVTLDSGDMTASFNDIALIKTSLPFKIAHIYKWSSEDFGCGRNWRLNLHQSLVKGSSENNGCDYIYTDGNGFKHGFIETYYYFDAEGKKISVAKSNVNFDIPTDTMWYEVSGQKCEVFKEQRTTSGMKLTTRLDGFKGNEYYDQRQKEEKQLEETLKTYKRNLGEYVIAEEKSEEIESLRAELCTNAFDEKLRNDYRLVRAKEKKLYLKINQKLNDSIQDGILLSDDFDSFIKDASNKILLQESDAVQLDSLYTQRYMYQKQLNANALQKTLYRKSSFYASKHNVMMQNRSLHDQYNNLLVSLNEILNGWYDYKDKKNDEKFEGAKVRRAVDLFWQFKALNASNGAAFPFPENFKYFYYNEPKTGVFYDKGDDAAKERVKFFVNSQGKYYDKNDNVTATYTTIFSIPYAKFNTNAVNLNNFCENFEDANFDYSQLTVLKEQVESIKRQEDDLDTQLSLVDDSVIIEQIKQIDAQINFMKNRNKIRNEELQKLYKEYFNYSADFVKLKQTIAVATLSKDGMSLCFNEYGQLCALTDSYENSVVVEYDINNRISHLNDGKKSITFKYDYYGMLTSITDYNGNRVEYTYSGNSAGAALQSVKLANSDVITFSYTNNCLATVSSDLDKTKTKLVYGSPASENASSPLTSITNYSLVSKITDTGAETVSDSVALKNNVFSKIDFVYGVHECSITSDGKDKRYFMDDYGCLIGGFGQNDEGVLGAYSYVYVNREKNEMISVHETDFPIVKKENVSTYAILGSDLPSYQKEFVFSALVGVEPTLNEHPLPEESSVGFVVEGTRIPGNGLLGRLENQFLGKFQHPYLEILDSGSLHVANLLNTRKQNVFAGIRATVFYKGTKQTNQSIFETPLINRSEGCQLCAVPISLNLMAEVDRIELSLESPTEVNYCCKEIRFASAAVEYKTFDDFKELICSEAGNEFICSTSNGNRYRKNITTYKYNNEHLLLEKRVSSTDSIVNTKIRPSEVVTISKYAYNDKGAQLREEIFVNGELATCGSMVDENIYDEKGRVIKNQVYNSLESSSRKCSEKGYHEKDDSVEYELDVLGENKVAYEYDSMTNEVLSVTSPNGSKLTYSRDCNTHAVTGLSQSNEDGESNFVESHYNCGLVTRRTSGTNSITYEYNSKREKTAVYFNGVKKVDYAYNKDAELKAEIVNGISFDAVAVEKSTATLWGNNNECIVTEACMDSKKNLIQTSLGKKTLFRSNYSDKKELLNSVDYVTGTTTSSDYDKQNRRLNSIARSKGAEREYDYLKSVKESYKYDAMGKLSEHTIEINDSEIQKYEFEYSSNVARTLKSVKLPNGLTYEPQKDFLGRCNGKTLLDAAGEKLFGEYVSYRKVGNHTSDMVSSIRYGEVRNGKFSISEGLRYKYDVCGNITEKWEKGKLLAAYAYDHLSRIVREDNAAFGKTWLFSYDSNGNRVTKIEMPFTRQSTSELVCCTDVEAEQYSYEGDILMSRNSEVFEYDGFGNPILFKGKNLAWENGKLMKFENLDFAYDGYGKRVRKGATYFTYDTGKDLIQMEKDGNVMEFIYDDNGLSGMKYKNQQYVLRRNVEKDVTHIFTLEGKMVARYEYDAWGNHKVVDENGEEITDQSHVANVNPFRYRGYIYDVETNLYYLINRYYDPDTGRFISQDQISYLQPEHVNGLNLFAYCENNPIMRIDESGCGWLKNLWNDFKDFVKKIGRAIVKAAMFIAGVVMAVVGFALALAAVGTTFAMSLIPGTFLGNTIMGCAFQFGMSVGMYGVFMAGASHSDTIYDDMEAIGWNPFNSDADAVIDSSRVSFYKGIPVIRSSLARSFNFGFIALSNDLSMGAHHMKPEDVLNHEFGHHVQMAVLGPSNYFWCIGIPSMACAGSDEYYDNSWENTANEMGHVDNCDYAYTNTPIPIDHEGNAKHLILSALLGPFYH